jgi:CRP-like cAMP-binding protein
MQQVTLAGPWVASGAAPRASGEQVRATAGTDGKGTPANTPTGEPAGAAGDGAGRHVNHLLRLLQIESPREAGQLRTMLEPVTLTRGEMLSSVGGTIANVYFPEGGVISMVKVLADGKRIEVGTAGVEGMSGLPVLLGAGSMPVECVAQVPGSARRLSATALREATAEGSTLREILLRYAQFLFDQAAQTAACNRVHTVGGRCARWLLMTHDRVGGVDSFALTQEYLAVMLGVRRASVSKAAESLQRDGSIRYHRGQMTIVHRAKLEAIACECYASDRADYERLLGKAASQGGSAIPPMARHDL